MRSFAPWRSSSRKGDIGILDQNGVAIDPRVRRGILFSFRWFLDRCRDVRLSAINRSLFLDLGGVNGARLPRLRRHRRSPATPTHQLGRASRLLPNSKACRISPLIVPSLRDSGCFERLPRAYALGYLCAAATRLPRIDPILERSCRSHAVLTKTSDACPAPRERRLMSRREPNPWKVRRRSV